MPETFLNNLHWRYATKEFDSSKKVSEENLVKTLKSIQYSPSSYGLQPYHIYVVSDEKVKRKMKLATFLQKQADTCSHMIVFCARVDKDDVLNRIDDYVNLTAKINETSKLKLQPMKLMMKGSVKKRDREAHVQWASEQCHIALGFALAAATELNIDSCPMGGFDKNAICKLIRIPKHLSPVALLPIGYRKEEPKRKKVRFSKEDLFTEI